MCFIREEKGGSILSLFVYLHGLAWKAQTLWTNGNEADSENISAWKGKDKLR